MVIFFKLMCRLILPLSTSAKSIKIDQEKPRVIIKNKVARFYGSRCSCCCLLFAGEIIFDAMSKGSVHNIRQISAVLVEGLVSIGQQQNVRQNRSPFTSVVFVPFNFLLLIFYSKPAYCTASESKCRREHSLRSLLVVEERMRSSGCL